MTERHRKKNRYMYGMGTIGRDMVYSIFSLQLMFYLTDVLEISTETLVQVTLIMMVIRIFDAVNDPFMGVIVDNTKSRWGKFKPWILIGAVLSGIFTVIMFTNFGLEGGSFLLVFTLVYVLWEVSFTANDIAYWSMLPSLSQDPKEREKIGAVARICANIGMFSFVVGVVPITNWLAGIFGSLQIAYTVFAVAIVLIMWFFQAFTLFGVKEEVKVSVEETTKVSELLSIIFKNDQLLWTTISLMLFQIGYITTTSFGLYFFKYVYGDENMYAVFAAILGVTQITALAIYPLFSKRFTRRQLFFGSTVLICLGYLIFFFAPTDTMLFIGLAGVLLFAGDAFIQLLMLMFISDCVEYGEWKLGRRNDSVTLSLQPFINKMGSAVAAGIVGFTLVISGMKEAEGPQDMTSEGLQIFKSAMLILPLLLIVLSYLIYRWKYRIDEAKFSEIVNDLAQKREAGQIPQATQE